MKLTKALQIIVELVAIITGAVLAADGYIKLFYRDDHTGIISLLMGVTIVLFILLLKAKVEAKQP